VPQSLANAGFSHNRQSRLRTATLRSLRDVPRLIQPPRREHSRKPAEVVERIERLVDGPYLELFAREPRSGWDAWGDRVARFAA
jgi:N6-adenosine-specific RNA methylase IME4